MVIRLFLGACLDCRRLFLTLLKYAISTVSKEYDRIDGVSIFLSLSVDCVDAVIVGVRCFLLRVLRFGFLSISMTPSL